MVNVLKFRSLVDCQKAYTTSADPEGLSKHYGKCSKIKSTS